MCMYEARKPCSAVGTRRGAIAGETAPRARPVTGGRRVTRWNRGLSWAIRDDVPLDKWSVSYYSFHIYLVFTAGGAAAPGKGSRGAMRRHSEICKASAMLRRLRMVGLRLPCSI